MKKIIILMLAMIMFIPNSYAMSNIQKSIRANRVNRYVRIASEMLPSHIDIPVVESTCDNCEDDSIAQYFFNDKTIGVNNIDYVNEVVILHEIGHHTMHGTAFPVCDSYITDYAEVNYYEDRAESFSMYVIGGNHFRILASNNECFANKYEYLRDNVFNGEEYDSNAWGGRSSSYKLYYEIN